MDVAPGTTVDRYTVVRLLGRGGMASVFLARHAQIGSPHALKVLTVASADIRARLLQEGRAQGAVRHPNIVAVTDAVQVDGALALILEYVAGPTLAELLAAGPLDLDQVDALARGVLRGIAAAHRRGLVHRDLKPANVLLALADGRVTPKIADFGLVKVVTQPGATRSGATMGTPSYMAPEQIRDASTVDARADVFAAGCVLHELITGRRAFDGPDTYAVFRAVSEGHRAPLDRDVPDRMRVTIERALCADPAGRFADGQALLDAWVDGTPEPTPTWSLEEREEPAPAASVALTYDTGSTALPPDTGHTLSPPDTGHTLTPDEAAASSLPDEPPPWTAFLWTFPVATLLAAPFVVGFVRAAFGDVATGIGGWLVPMLALTAMSVGALATLFRGELAGRIAPFWLWFAGPLLLCVVTALGTAQGALVVAEAPPVASAADAAMLTALGVSEVAGTELIGDVLGACLLVATSVLGVALLALRSGLPDRVDGRMWAFGLAAFVASLGMWAVSEQVWAGGPAPFLVFVIVVAACADAVWVTAGPAGERAGQWRARVLVAAPTAAHVAALAVWVDEQLWWFARFGRDAPMDRLMAAEQFLDEFARVGSFTVVLGWTAIPLAVAVVVLLRGDPLGMARPWRTVAPTLLAAWAASLAMSGATTLRLVASERIAPAFLADAVFSTLGVTMEDQGGAIVVTGERGPWKAGDVVLAVADRPQDDVGALVHALRDCWCGHADACALVDGCVEAGSTLPVTVRRGSGADARLETLTVTLPGR